MPIIFLSAILGPEMAAPILWAPAIFWFFLLEKPHAHKIPRFRGGRGFFGRGGGSANSIFMGVGIFPIYENLRESFGSFVSNFVTFSETSFSRRAVLMSASILKGGGWAREIGTICPFGVFSPVLWQFLAQFEANPCSEANCGVVTFSLRHFRWFGVLEPHIHHLSFSGPKMAFSSSQNTTF